MSTLGIVVIAVAAVLLLLLLGGFVAGRRHHAANEARTVGNIAAADRALEHARAADKGWDRAALEAAARDALQGSRPDWAYDDLVLVLVDDRPGTEQDRAHFMASGGGDQARLVLARTGDGWALERIE
jgi:type II secretory pathway pseudopilin PulG